jgi:hypothetical protein
MKTILVARASALLYNLLFDRDDRRHFLLPTNICPIVPVTFFKAGMPFEFIDISADTLHVDLRQAEGRIRTGRCGGLLYTHTYGDPSTPQDFFRMVKQFDPGLLLIDDRCLCVPDLMPDPATAADITLFSVGYGKIADMPHAGFAFLSEDLAYQSHPLPFQRSDLYELEKDYERSIERRERYSYRDSAWLQTFSDPPAWPEFAERVRTTIKESIAHRRSINAVYNSLIPASLRLDEKYQLWRFNLRVPDKKKIIDAIFEANLFASSYYASLAGIMDDGSCPVAQQLADEVINLFNDAHYTLDMAETTAKIILENLS